jgi:hypothetical protein
MGAGDLRLEIKDLLWRSGFHTRPVITLSKQGWRLETRAKGQMPFSLAERLRLSAYLTAQAREPGLFNYSGVLKQASAT